jgi:hypothetical protein
VSKNVTAAPAMQPNPTPKKERTVEEYAEGIYKSLRNSGLQVNVVQGGVTEDDVEKVYPRFYNIYDHNPQDLFDELNSLEEGDSVSFAQFGEKLYYFPKQFPNIYNDPLKREAKEKKEAAQEKRKIKSSRRIGNNNARMMWLEDKVSRFEHLGAAMEDQRTATERLLKVKESREVDRDQVMAHDQWLNNMKKDIEKLTEKMDKIYARLGLQENVKQEEKAAPVVVVVAPAAPVPDVV